MSLGISTKANRNTSYKCEKQINPLHVTALFQYILKNQKTCYTPWKREKNPGFLTFSGSIEGFLVFWRGIERDWDGFKEAVASRKSSLKLATLQSTHMRFKNWYQFNNCQNQKTLLIIWDIWNWSSNNSIYISINSF